MTEAEAATKKLNGKILVKTPKDQTEKKRGRVEKLMMTIPDHLISIPED